MEFPKTLSRFFEIPVPKRLYKIWGLEYVWCYPKSTLDLAYNIVVAQSYVVHHRGSIHANKVIFWILLTLALKPCWKIKDIILGFDSPFLIITCECVVFFYWLIILLFFKQLPYHVCMKIRKQEIKDIGTMPGQNPPREENPIKIILPFNSILWDSSP